MLNYQPNEIKQTKNEIQTIIHPEDKESYTKILNQYLARKSNIYLNEYRMLSKDKKWKWILSIGKIVEKDDNADPKRMIGIHMDITERKKTQRQILDYNEKLEKINRNKDKLFSIIAHDLKCPLTSIKGFSEFLLSNHSTLSHNEIRESVGNIYKSANTFQSILESLFEWGRM